MSCPSPAQPFKYHVSKITEDKKKSPNKVSSGWKNETEEENKRVLQQERRLEGEREEDEPRFDGGCQF